MRRYLAWRNVPLGLLAAAAFLIAPLAQEEPKSDKDVQSPPAPTPASLYAKLRRRMDDANRRFVGADDRNRLDVIQAARTEFDREISLAKLNKPRDLEASWRHYGKRLRAVLQEYGSPGREQERQILQQAARRVIEVETRQADSQRTEESTSSQSYFETYFQRMTKILNPNTPGTLREEMMAVANELFTLQITQSYPEAGDMLQWYADALVRTDRIFPMSSDSERQENASANQRLRAAARQVFQHAVQWKAEERQKKK